MRIHRRPLFASLGLCLALSAPALANHHGGGGGGGGDPGDPLCIEWRETDGGMSDMLPGADGGTDGGAATGERTTTDYHEGDVCIERVDTFGCSAAPGAASRAHGLLFVVAGALALGAFARRRVAR